MKNHILGFIAVVLASGHFLHAAQPEVKQTAQEKEAIEAVMAKAIDLLPIDPKQALSEFQSISQNAPKLGKLNLERYFNKVIYASSIYPVPGKSRDYKPDEAFMKKYGLTQTVRSIRTPASYADKELLLKLFMSWGVDINSQDRFPELPLMRAIINDNAELAQLLLAHGADIAKIRDYSGGNALHVAADRAEHTLAVLLEYLKSNGQLVQFINALNADGQTPLMIAVKQEYEPALAELLLRFGADPLIKNDKGRNALEIAQRSLPPKSPIIPMLQAAMKGAQSEAKAAAAVTEVTPKTFSAIIERVNQMIQQPLKFEHEILADLAAVDALAGNEGWKIKAKAWATIARSNFKEKVRKLRPAPTRPAPSAVGLERMERGVVPEPTVQRVTIQIPPQAALGIAFNKRHMDVLGIIKAIKDGAELSKFRLERSPMFGPYEDLSAFGAIAYKTKPNFLRNPEIDLLGVRVPSLIIHDPSNMQAAILALLRLGFNINENKIDKRGKTPLIAAAEYNNIAMIELLLLFDAGITLTDNEGNTPLHWAFGSPHAVPLLIEHLKKIGHGEDINAQNNKGNTPLMEAIERQLDSYWDVLAVCKLLMHFWVDPTITNKQGETALDLVKRIKSEKQRTLEANESIFIKYAQEFEEKYGGPRRKLYIQKLLEYTPLAGVMAKEVEEYLFGPKQRPATPQGELKTEAEEEEEESTEPAPMPAQPTPAPTANPLSLEEEMPEVD